LYSAPLPLGAVIIGSSAGIGSAYTIASAQVTGVPLKILTDPVLGTVAATPLPVIFIVHEVPLGQIKGVEKLENVPLKLRAGLLIRENAAVDIVRPELILLTANVMLLALNE
jgi:hypothetical protein